MTADNVSAVPDDIIGLLRVLGVLLSRPLAAAK